jgi:hypothetical protein
MAMTSSAAAGVHVCRVCAEPAAVFRFDGDTAAPLCAQHLLLGDAPAGGVGTFPQPDQKGSAHATS